MGKKGIVLAGGGSRGAYQIGAWRALREIGFDYEIVTGTSVGGLNGAMFTIGDLELGEKMWQQITTEKVMNFTPEGDVSTPEAQREILLTFVEKAMKEKFDQTPLRDLLVGCVDVDKVYASPVDFGLVTMKYPSFKPVLLFKDQIPKEHFIDFLMATSACFPAMRPYEIDGETYIDGGYYDNMPVEMAVNRGADELVVINLRAIGIRRIYHNKKITITEIAPKEDLGFILLFDADFAKLNMRRGYLDTYKAFERCDGWLYTFEKDAFDRASHEMGSLTGRISRRIRTDLLAEDVFMRHAAAAFRRCLEHHSDPIFAAGNCALCCAELAGKIFGISPLEIYSRPAFDAALLKAYDAVRVAPESDFIDAIKLAGDEKYVTKFLVCELGLLLQGKPVNPVVMAAADLAPTALCAAVYCLLAAMQRKSLLADTEKSGGATPTQK